MPEGDTLFQIAARLREQFAGEVIEFVGGSALHDLQSRLRTASPKPSTLQESSSLESVSAAQPATKVVQIESRGKHLLIHFDNELVLHSHLGMTGSWHTYPSSKQWTKPLRNAYLVLRSASRFCVCFSPKTLELLTATQLRRHPQLSRLGPDLLSPEFDALEAAKRFQSASETECGVALLDQRIVCGIGNVYKSELLFLENIHPWLHVGQVNEQQWSQLLARAQHLLRRNLEGRARRSRFGRDGRRLWVYGHQDEPCLRCGTRIKMKRQGQLGRSSYWCPSCQR